MPTIEEIKTALGNMGKSSEKPLIETSNILHENINPTQTSEKIFSSVEKLQRDIQDRDMIIESLKKESTELKNQVLEMKEMNSTILEELNKARWLQNKVTLATKKVYEDKVKSVVNQNMDSKIIPILTSVGRRKQGNQQLNWGNWLKITENRYLYELNQDIAKKIFKDSNTLIYEEPTRGSGVVKQKNYSLSFSGDRSGATETFVSTNFNPDTYSLWNGFTISFWVRPDEEMNQKSVILGTRASSPVARFHFGLSGAGVNNIGVGVGGNDVTGINNPMEIGRWYNWVISYTGTQFDAGERKLRMWINTDARMTSNNSTSWNNQDEATENYTHGIYFGGRNTEGSGYTSGFACALDEVAIYNRCIDSEGTFANEVYNGGVNYDHQSNGQSGLVGYWKFNEGTGISIRDHTDNGNDGTFGAIAGQTTAFPIWELLPLSGY